ncbi:MAG TPA: TlpA disulfide reductase family protein [Anaerolineae bacterium]
MTRRRRSSTPSRSAATSPIVWAIATILFTMLIIGGLGFTGLGSASAARVGSTADFTLNDFSSQPVRLSNYRGHPVLVNLWASWCPPCRAEMPDLIQFYNTHQKDGLVLLAVNSADDKSSAQQFAREKAMPFPVLLDPTGSVERLFGVDGLPSTFLIDKTGTVRFAWTGQITPAVLDQRVTPLLSQ